MKKREKISQEEKEELLNEIMEMKPKEREDMLKKSSSQTIEFMRPVFDLFFERLKETKSGESPYGEYAAWDFGHELYDYCKLDYRETLSEIFPEYADSRLYKDMKADLLTILQSEKLDIYQIDACLKLDADLTRKMLREDKKLREKVEDSLSNPENFLLLEEMKKSGRLGDLFDTDKLLKTATERLYAMSGKDVFRILRHGHNNMEQEQRAEKLYDILSEYYDQTEYLNHRHDTDLCYTSYNKDERWGAKQKSWLQEVGKYADQPAMEKMLEQRVARIYSYFSYPAINLREGKERYVERSFSYMSRAGAEMYAELMTQSLLADPTSTQSKFYLENAKAVFDQYRCEYLYLEVAEKVLPKLLPTHPEICDKMYKEMDESSMRHVRVSKETVEKWQKTILENPDSELAKFYLEHIKYPSSHYVYDLLDVAKTVFKEFKETRPDVCDKLCETVIHSARLGNERRGGNVQEEYLAELYAIYPNPQLSEHMNKGLESEEINKDWSYIASYAERFEITGLEGYKKLIAKCIEESFHPKYDLGYAKGRLEINDLSDKYTYKEMFEQIRQSNVIAITVYSRNKKEETSFALDAGLLVPNKKLRQLGSYYHYDSKLPAKQILLNPEKLLEQAPNLEKLEYTTDDAGRDAAFTFLMRQKPENLMEINLQFSDEQAILLMEKYPGLVVGDRYDKKSEKAEKLFSRNQKIVDAIEEKNGKERVRKAINNGVLMEVMSVMPKSKMPKLEDFDDEIMKLMREKYGQDAAQTMQKIAKLSKLDGVQKESELLMAVRDKKVVEYLRSLPASERPSVAKLSKPTALGLRKPDGSGMSVFEEIRKVYKNEGEYLMVAKEVLTIVGVTKNDIEKAAGREDIGDALKMLMEEKQIAKEKEQGKADFMAWMAKNNKNDGPGK